MDALHPLVLVILLLAAWAFGFLTGHGIGVRRSFKVGFDAGVNSFKKVLNVPDGYEIDHIGYRRSNRGK